MIRKLSLRRPRGALGAALAYACVFSTVTASLRAQTEHEGSEFQERRQAWFDGQRAYPNAQVDWNAIMRARALAASSGRATLAPSFPAAAGGRWMPFGAGGFFGDSYWGSGPQLDAGRVDAIALHPFDAGTLFIASPNGGVWRTTTGGASWTPVTDDQCTLQMSTVAVDPVNPNFVYAVAAYASGAANCAILRSTDGGLTWSSYNGGLSLPQYSGGYGNVLYIDPASAGTDHATTLLMGGAWGIFRSANSGVTWSRPFTGSNVTSVVGLPGKPGVVFAGVPHAGLYRSADNGSTWTRVSTGQFDFSKVARVQLAVAPGQPNTVWMLGGSDHSLFHSLSRWDDASGQLTPLAAAGIDPVAEGRVEFGGQATYDLSLAVDPEDARRIYVAGVRAFRSVDGGATFAPMATEIHCDWHTIVVDPRNPNQLYAGTDGGVYVSADAGETWFSRNAWLVISMYYPGISQHPTNPSIVLGGLQDNGSLISDGTAFYSSVTGGDGGYAAINYANPTTVWTTCQWLPGPCITKRTQTAGVFSYPDVTTGIGRTDRAGFIPPFVMDPVTPTTLYFGTTCLYKTTNDGALWTRLTGDLSHGNGVISAIAVAPSDPLTIYVGSSDGNVQVSRDGGATFTPRLTGLPNRYVTDFAVDQADPTRALVTVSGTAVPHVYLTTNGGANWTNVSGDLVDMPANAVVMIDDSPTHFLVGTDAGVYETADGGQTWTGTPAGMPHAVVNDLSYNPRTKQLVAATFGRGLFSYSFANPTLVLRGDVDGDGAINAFDALLIQQALVGTPLPSGTNALPRGDTDCDNHLSAPDVLIALRAAVGLTTAGACVGTMR